MSAKLVFLSFSFQIQSARKEQITSPVPKSEIEENAFQQLTPVGGWGTATRNVFGALRIALMAMFVNQEDFWKIKESKQELTSKHA